MDELRRWLVDHGYPVNGTVIIPDADWAWSYFLKNMKFSLPLSSTIAPIDVPDELCHKQSICRLLFAEDTYDVNNDFLTLYTVDQKNISSSYRYKLLMLPLPLLMFPTDDTDGYNLWKLQSDELAMLNMYLSKLRNDVITLPDFSTLVNPLAKLIHIKLDVDINKNAVNLSDTIIADDRLIVQCYEVFVRYYVYRKLLEGEHITL